VNGVPRCPVCKAENAQGPACRRCRADLSLLWRAEARRAWALAAARRALAAGRWAEAAARAAEANGLRGDAESRRLAALTHLMRRDFARAWSYYRSDAGEVRSAGILSGPAADGSQLTS
jgi:hypothetical protein